MVPLQIKRQRFTNVDDKIVLRANIDQLPLEKQLEFVNSAIQLISKRTGLTETEVRQLYQPSPEAGKSI